jgi:hypothetical protein
VIKNIQIDIDMKRLIHNVFLNCAHLKTSNL